MPRYVVQHRYSSVDSGVVIGPFAAGDEVELDVERAEWVNRDSPGALVPVRAAPAVEVPAADDPPRATATRTSGPKAKA